MKEKSRYKIKAGWLPKLEWGRNQNLTKTQHPDTDSLPSRRSWREKLKVVLLVLLAVLVGIIYWKGWRPTGMGYSLQVLDDSVPVAEGTICNLFMELEKQGSSLLPVSDEQVLYQWDSVLDNGMKASMRVSTESPPADRLGAIAGVDVQELIHFEILTQQRARLVFADGSCEIYQLAEVLQLLRETDKCDLFQAIAHRGEAYEYFNIMYTESFEKIVCEEGTFYRARMNISKARCPAGHSLLNCGTDLFSAYIYNKLRRRLETMDPNSDYSYRRSYELYPCKCVEYEGLIPEGELPSS